MKINKDIRSQLDARKPKKVTSKKKALSFDAMVMEQSEKLQVDQLEQLMGEISDQSERLVRYRTIRELAKFKRFVKDFMQEAVQYGLDISYSHTFQMNGNSRRLLIVRQIDEKLIELTEAVVEQEKRSIDLLDMIGEIKGMLINLYS